MCEMYPPVAGCHTFWGFVRLIIKEHEFGERIALSEADGDCQDNPRRSGIHCGTGCHSVGLHPGGAYFDAQHLPGNVPCYAADPLFEVQAPYRARLPPSFAFAGSFIGTRRWVTEFQNTTVPYRCPLLCSPLSTLSLRAIIRFET